jgi:hypothetical protein
MDGIVTTPAQSWPWWRKIIFRFCFIYLIFEIAPWTWLDDYGLSYITQYYRSFINWMVHIANSTFFHVRKELVPLNGSGDTSYGWVQLWMFISLAVIGCAIWSVVDRKRPGYTWLNYWLCLFARYYVASVAFSYGIIKIFCLQMGFPGLHMLATPLGDLLPMRLSWLFIGYSGPYQIFSGIMEVTAGLLLIYRRTATLGALVATAVFINVMMLNLSYDIPVKIFSMQLVFVCLFLLANESKRIICFFILNRPADACSVYHFNYNKKWMRITRIVLKVLFIFLNLIFAFYKDYSYVQYYDRKADKQMLKNGVYEVTDYSIGKRNTPLAVTDTLRWKNVVLEYGTGSIETGDTTFKRTYNRAYFRYDVDTMTHTMAFKRRMPNDSLISMLNMKYTQPDSNTIKLWGWKGKDSLFVELKRTKRHFQLAEKQFHWLSEYNR